MATNIFRTLFSLRRIVINLREKRGEEKVSKERKIFLLFRPALTNSGFFLVFFFFSAAVAFFLSALFECSCSVFTLCTMLPGEEGGGCSTFP